MNHVANQLIFKVISVQKFSSLVQKFKDLLKNTSKWDLTHFRGHTHINKIWGRTHIKQRLPTQTKFPVPAF